MNCAVSRFLACVVVSSAFGIPPARADDARLAVPPEDKVENSLGLIRDAYEADYKAAKESGDPEQLIAQLRGSAGQEADPVRKYALLVEAENVAAAHDSYRKAVELLNARAELFQIDGLALKGTLLKRLAGPKVTADLDLCEQAMDTAREAMRSDRFRLAADAASLAVSIAKAIDREQKAAARKQRRPDGRNVVAPSPIGVELVKKTTALQSQVTATEKSFEQYEAAAETAKTAPDDAAANGFIGSYLCFVRGDWKAGLPALAKGNLPEFASLAADELKLAAASGPMDPQQAFALAGSWWSAAEAKGVSDEWEAAIKDHAAALYAAIVDRLEGTLEKKVAGSRLRGQTAGVHAIGQGGETVDKGRKPPPGGSDSAAPMARLSRIENEGYARLVQDHITLEEGKEYTFSVRMAGNVVLHHTDHIPYFNRQGANFEGFEYASRTSSFRDGWTTYEAVVKPPKTDSYELHVSLWNLPSIDVANISLRSSSSGDELIRNGGFTDALNGWRTNGGKLTLVSPEQQSAAASN